MTPSDTVGLYSNQDAMFAGWGRYDKSLETSDFLRETEFNVLTTEHCVSEYSYFREDIVDGALFCAEHQVSTFLNKRIIQIVCDRSFCFAEGSVVH